jgi:membrane protease YdiL (CAAX protease family)
LTTEPGLASSVEQTREQAASTSTTKGTIAYLILSFGLAWGAVGLLWVLGLTTKDPLWTPLSLLLAFAPAIAAIVVRRWVTHEGFADAGLWPNLRRSWPYYVFAWLWPLLFVAVLGVGLLFGLSTYKSVGGVLAPLIVTAFVSAPIFWGEEFGWRSYLQIRLFADRPLKAALATGLIWGVWHLPAVGPNIIPSQHGLLSLVLIPWFMIAFSIILGWLRLRTGSVWAPSLAHAGANMFLGSLGTVLWVSAPGYGDLLLEPRGLLVVIPMLALCAWIVLSGQLKAEPQAPQRDLRGDALRCTGRELNRQYQR